MKSDLCGFEGAKPKLQAKQKQTPNKEVARPFDGRSDVWRKAEARGAGGRVRRQFDCRLTVFQKRGSESDETHRVSARQQKAGAPLLSGDNSLRVPPVPIPNTEVKPQHADSTWLETAR